MKSVKLLNFLRDRLDNNEIGLWFALAYIRDRDQKGEQTKITDLVQKIEFGTGPTVHRKIQELEELGLIVLEQSPTDARVKRIVTTELAEQHINSLEAEINEVLA